MYLYQLHELIGCAPSLSLFTRGRSAWHSRRDHPPRSLACSCADDVTTQSLPLKVVVLYAVTVIFQHGGWRNRRTYRTVLVVSSPFFVFVFERAAVWRCGRCFPALVSTLTCLLFCPEPCFLTSSSSPNSKNSRSKSENLTKDGRSLSVTRASSARGRRARSAEISVSSLSPPSSSATTATSGSYAEVSLRSSDCSVPLSSLEPEQLRPA